MKKQTLTSYIPRADRSYSRPRSGAENRPRTRSQENRTSENAFVNVFSLSNHTTSAGGVKRTTNMADKRNIPDQGLEYATECGRVSKDAIPVHSKPRNVFQHSRPVPERWRQDLEYALEASLATWFPRAFTAFCVMCPIAGSSKFKDVWAYCCSVEVSVSSVWVFHQRVDGPSHLPRSLSGRSLKTFPSWLNLRGVAIPAGIGLGGLRGTQASPPR
jgi:hypothetical protein